MALGLRNNLTYYVIIILFYFVVLEINIGNYYFNINILISCGYKQTKFDN